MIIPVETIDIKAQIKNLEDTYQTTLIRVRHLNMSGEKDEYFRFTALINMKVANENFES